MLIIYRLPIGLLQLSKVVDKKNYINTYGVAGFSNYDELFAANKDRVVELFKNCIFSKLRVIN